MSHWLEQALQDGLETIDGPELLKQAIAHVQLEDTQRDQRAEFRISPTLISEECSLAAVKRYRHHDPQPGWKWRSVKRGRPSASSNMHTFRGTIAEGMVIAALRAVSLGEGTGRYPFQIIGVSPTCVFETQVWSETMFPAADGSMAPLPVNYLAYPDILMLVEGRPELVQLKCPSVYGIARYKRDGPATVHKRYGPQAIAEMVIGRWLGVPIQRNHILLYAFEGTLPSSEESKAGRELLTALYTEEWDPNMEQFVRMAAERIVELNSEASRGRWPLGYAVGTTWPCDYCNYPRTDDGSGLASCEENHKWEPQQLTSSTATTPPALPAASSSTTAPPAASTQPLSLSAPARPPSAPSGQVVSLAPLQEIPQPPAHLQPKQS